MREFDQYINGKWVKSTSTKVTEVLNPCTEEVISIIPEGSVEDANKALDAAKNAQFGWKSMTAIERAGYLHKMASVIRENRVFFSKNFSCRTS
jgi:lactaldehyde dehydrogenase/glycolaldehyde dehydrogenase